jgi:hypothetical protein
MFSSVIVIVLLILFQHQADNLTKFSIIDPSLRKVPKLQNCTTDFLNETDNSQNQKGCQTILYTVLGPKQLWVDFTV